jgi:hypothetical protein
MKLKWVIIGIVAAAAGSFMLKHLVDTKKAFLPFVDNNNEKNYGNFPHEIFESDFDDADYLA